MNDDQVGKNWKVGAKSVLLQLVREMGVPFVVSICWTIYSLFSSNSKRNLVDAVTVFSGSFFLICWGFSQWFRVKKQQAVETGLGGIVKRQEALVNALAEATERLEGHASGGKGIAWLMLAQPKDGVISNITALVEGKYPLMDAHANVMDLSKMASAADDLRHSGKIQDFFKYNIHFNCGTLQPEMAIMQKPTIPCDTTKDKIRFRIDWAARNGRWTQYVELKRVNKGYIFYTAVKRNNEWVYENPSRENIPKLANGKPDVFWHFGDLAENVATEGSSNKGPVS